MGRLQSLAGGEVATARPRGSPQVYTINVRSVQISQGYGHYRGVPVLGGGGRGEETSPPLAQGPCAPSPVRVWKLHKRFKAVYFRQARPLFDTPGGCPLGRNL